MVVSTIASLSVKSFDLVLKQKNESSPIGSSYGMYTFESGNANILQEGVAGNYLTVTFSITKTGNGAYSSLILQYFKATGSPVSLFESYAGNGYK